MPSNSICCFERYLDNHSQQYFVKPSDNFKKCIDKFTDTGFIDKVGKLVAPCFEFGEFVAKWQEAPKEVVDGFHGAHEVVKVGRDFLGIFNIFNGVFKSLVEGMSHIWLLGKNLIVGSNDPYNFKAVPENPREDLNHNDTAVTFGEKLCALIEQIGKWVSSFAFFIGFSICRPIANFKKYIFKDIDPRASKIGEAFPTVMLCLHVAGGVANVAGGGFQYLAYNRDTKVAAQLAQARVKRNEKAYHHKILENGVGLSLKILEVASSALHHAKVATPPAVHFPLQISIGMLSVAKEWIK